MYYLTLLCTSSLLFRLLLELCTIWQSKSSVNWWVG